MYQKSLSHDVRVLRYGARQTEFFVILDQFLAFYPPNNTENQNYENSWRYYHFTDVYQNHYHMLYYSWDMARDGCNFYFSFWPNFSLLNPPNSPKNQNFLKNEKKMPGYIIILHICTKNYNYMIYGSWDMVRNGRTDGKSDRGGCPT